MPYLPLFPLNLVAYPGEKLNLHVFEPRYVELINDCMDLDRRFGVPTYLNERIPGYGTEVEVMEISHRYDDGRMDIKTRGIRTFRITDFVNPAPGKLYAHGEIYFYEEDPAYGMVIQDLIDLVHRLYRILDAPTKLDPHTPQPLSYQIGHGIGLSLEGEYELLTIQGETERQLFLLSHLREVLPVVENMERSKERIRLNGHFKELNPLDW
jgi:ATP-dependent protease La (LON) substrate-binding domain